MSVQIQPFFSRLLLSKMNCAMGSFAAFLTLESSESTSLFLSFSVVGGVVGWMDHPSSS
jgi:hypothetical protein